MTEPTMYVGKYEIKERLGSGAFATVWLAHDPALRVDVAIKVLATNWCGDEEVEGRFLQEARILFQLNDPRIIKVYTTGEHTDGCPFFVMDHADRGNLQQRLEARARENEPYDIREALLLSREIAEGLRVIHAAGIVHRDLKPSNVLFRSDTSDPNKEQMMLGDFGIARELDAESRNTIVAGSPYYMAPEQAEEATAATVDQRADIYSAAVILHELLTGRVPYPFSTMSEIRRAQLAGERIPLDQLRANIPATVIWLVEQGMQLDPADRYPSVDAWISALDTALAGLSDAPAAGAFDAAAIPTQPAETIVPAAAGAAIGAMHHADAAQTLQDPLAIAPGPAIEGPVERVEAAAPAPPAAPPAGQVAVPAAAGEPPRKRRALRALLFLLVVLVLAAAIAVGVAWWYDDWSYITNW
ncbi:MAG: hypothetical protein DCC58_02240 [Chloroflexi bacterium]|nr:MAG: hypothetical protein DCC58_02240 [Chloroflexota bacterium]